MHKNIHRSVPPGRRRSLRIASWHRQSDVSSHFNATPTTTPITHPRLIQHKGIYEHAREYSQIGAPVVVDLCRLRVGIGNRMSAHTSMQPPPPLPLPILD